MSLDLSTRSGALGFCPSGKSDLHGKQKAFLKQAELVICLFETSCAVVSPVQMVPEPLVLVHIALQRGFKNSFKILLFSVLPD